MPPKRKTKVKSRAKKIKSKALKCEIKKCAISIIPDDVLIIICSYLYYHDKGEAFINFLMKAPIYAFKSGRDEEAMKACFFKYHGNLAIFYSEWASAPTRQIANSGSSVGLVKWIIKCEYGSFLGAYNYNIEQEFIRYNKLENGSVTSVIYANDKATVHRINRLIFDVTSYLTSNQHRVEECRQNYRDLDKCKQCREIMMMSHLAAYNGTKYDPIISESIHDRDLVNLHWNVYDDKGNIKYCRQCKVELNCSACTLKRINITVPRNFELRKLHRIF